MPRILIITNNLRQASFRLRIQALLPLLEERGIETEVRVRPRGWLARRRLLKSAGQYDATILQRKLIDPSDAALLRRHAKQIFYDIDDAVMIHAHPVGWISRWRTRRRFEATARIADHVIAGNEYLAATFRQRGKPVTIIPTTVDPAHYRVKESVHNAADVALVWIGSRSTLPYLQERISAIESAARRIPNLRLIVIADQTIESTNVPIEFVPWSVDAEADALARADIGIAPTPDDSWTRGKCGFKIVQYMAAGLPVIASPVGANAQIVHEGITGLLVTDTQQWTDAIIRLASNPELRRSMSARGRERVEAHYTLARAANAWALLLNGVVTTQNN